MTSSVFEFMCVKPKMYSSADQHREEGATALSEHLNKVVATNRRNSLIRLNSKKAKTDPICDIIVQGQNSLLLQKWCVVTFFHAVS